MQDFTTERAKQLVNSGFYFNRSYYLQKSIKLVIPHWPLLMAYTAIYLGSMFALFAIDLQIGQIIQMVVTGPISAGYYIGIKRILDGKPLSIANFLEGFKIFSPTMLVFMIVNLLTTIGTAFYIIPGAFIATIYLFAMPLVVFGKVSFWNAMESSRIIIMSKFWESVMFGATIIGINFLGVLALGFGVYYNTPLFITILLGIGVLFTIPLSYTLILVAYEDIYGFDDIEKETNTHDNDFSHFR